MPEPASYILVTLDRDQPCRCGARRGLHRWPDEACPNRLWKTGNGQPQWLQITFQLRTLQPSEVQP